MQQTVTGAVLVTVPVGSPPTGGQEPSGVGPLKVPATLPPLLGVAQVAFGPVVKTSVHRITLPPLPQTFVSATLPAHVPVGSPQVQSVQLRSSVKSS